MARSDMLPPAPKFLMLASTCIVVAALYLARDVLIPLALAVLLTFLLAPLVSRVERWRLGRIPSVIIVVLLSLALIAFFGWVIGGQARELTEQLPAYRSSIHEKMQSVRQHLAELLKAQKAIDEVAIDATSQPTTAPAHATDAAARGTPQNPVYVLLSNVGESPLVPPRPFSSLESIAQGLGYLEPLATVVIVIVLVIFMLSQREDLRDRLIRLVGAGRLTVTTQALNEAGMRVSRYLLAQSMINGAFALVTSIGMAIIGVPNPLLWGLLCGLLRFIPYIGVWIGALFPILLSLVLPGWTRVLGTIAMFVGVELLTGNVLEPWLYGSSTGVSSLAILVAAVFWTWLWGGIGLLLSTPLTVCLVVIGKYVPHLEFLNVLLGDQPVLEPHERFYQRMLASDSEEARELVDEYLKDKPLEEVYDTVVMPALQMAQRDHQSGNLDDERHDLIRSEIRELIEEMRDEHATASRKADLKTEAKTEAAAVVAVAKDEAHALRKGRPLLPRDCAVNVFCLPAHDEADAVVGIMLAHLLEMQRYCVTAMSPDALASEMIEAAQTNRAQLVVVSAMPPGAIAHARYLCKRLNVQLPQAPVVVGLWLSKGDPQRARERLADSDAVKVATTLGEALDAIAQLVQPLIVGGNGNPVLAGQV